MSNTFGSFTKELNNKKFIEPLLKEKIMTYGQKYFRKILNMKPIIEIHIIKT